MNLLKKKTTILCVVAIFFCITSFFMITNANTNPDSPLYGEDVTLKLMWSESEMDMYKDINMTYDGVIIADEHTHTRPFNTYLKNKKSIPYQILSDGTIDKELLSSGLVIWRKDSIDRPVHVRDDHYVTEMLLGDKFGSYLNDNYSCISDVHSAKCYLSEINPIL